MGASSSLRRHGEGPTEGTPEVLPQGTPTEGMAGHCRDPLLREGTTAREQELETPLRGAPIERGPDWPSRVD
jgi:hypothetical protein